jgi:hypothetical protein
MGKGKSQAPRSAWRESEQPIRFAGATLGPERHICAFFSSSAEEYGVLLPFIKEGFERGEKAFHVVNPKHREHHISQLASVDIDAAEAEKEGQLELCDWNQAYLPDGRFDQDRMLVMWQESFDQAEEKGFSQTRLVAHMEWALEDREGVSDLLEYEAKLNLADRKSDPVICTYDLTKFRADVILDVMRTHPMMIVGGILQENPFYVQPDEFVRELRARNARGQASSAPAV